MSLKVAVICASNQNRSMEGHYVLAKRGFSVSSFGTNREVKLPGPGPDRPNIYAFGTPYRVMHEELKSKDEQLYTQNGLLQMLERNLRIKEAPERFQDSSDKFDLIITCEERCYDIVCEELMSKCDGQENRPVFVVNFEIKDNHEDAALGARAILQLVEMLSPSEADLASQFDQIMEKFQEGSNISTLHTVCFY